MLCCALYNFSIQSFPLPEASKFGDPELPSLLSRLFLKIALLIKTATKFTKIRPKLRSSIYLRKIIPESSKGIFKNPRCGARLCP